MKSYRDLDKFLTYAHPSCDETVVHLSSIRDLHEQIVHCEIQDLLGAYHELGAKTSNFIRYVEDEWR